MEPPLGNDSAALSMVNQKGESINEPDKMFELLWEHFAKRFRSDSKRDLTGFLAWLPTSPLMMGCGVLGRADEM